MTKKEVMARLEEHRDERGIAHWEKMGDETKGVASFGIGLTKLRKLAKEFGRDHNLAGELWKVRNYEAKVISLLIDEPKKLTREQVERQVEDVDLGLLAHVFSSCDATLAKAPFVFELAGAWIDSEDPIRVRCGYGLIYELSKNKRMAELTDEFFLGCLERICAEFESQATEVRMAMGSAMMGIGKRNLRLNREALKLAKKFGPIDFSDGDKACEPFDVAKHLTNEALLKKLRQA